MVRTYNIGTECYALITCPNEPEFLLPVKVVLLEKYTQGERTTYKVKIREILENDINYIKEHFSGVKVSMNLKTSTINTLLKKQEVESVNTMSELLQKLNDKPFYLEDNYIVPDRTGLIACDAPLPDCCNRGTSESDRMCSQHEEARHNRRLRICVAHNRFGQDPDFVQGSTVGYKVRFRG